MKFKIKIKDIYFKLYTEKSGFWWQYLVSITSFSYEIIISLTKITNQHTETEVMYHKGSTLINGIFLDKSIMELSNSGSIFILTISYQIGALIGGHTRTTISRVQSPLLLTPHVHVCKLQYGDPRISNGWNSI